jgi:diguanylate cyclase (GGDEF)-like protein
MTVREQHDHRTGISPRIVYPLAGLCLAAAAPVGALLIRMWTMAEVRVDPSGDVADNIFFYGYSLIGTALVFGVAGFIVGNRTHRLSREEAFYHRLSEVDALTGLLNQRAFREHFARMRQRGAQFGVPIALLMIDVDRLKQINDQHGHAAGSAALRWVSECIRESKRTTDVAARYGGDEFAVLMEGADIPAATRVADAIVAKTRTRKGLVPVTVTIGVAGGSVEDLFAAADRALYEGKAKGRDRVLVAG